MQYEYCGEGAAKKGNKTANKNELQKCKIATKGGLQKCKKFLLGKRYFLFLCKMPCYAGSRVSLCKTGVKQFESGKIGILDNVGTVFATNKSA
ncbi:hypothetical protein [Akkermansia muciniphila]|jgi:hypothetical protein|uniref:hypothetical protein n=1 Tax=Akkermansia muciniphila TaxID=239935 RepID=UPI000FFF0BA4|nr:hypothetical protein [Akkermansia muciniphila]